MPPGVVLEVVMLRVEVPETLKEAGLNVAAAPAGRPVTLNTTVPPKPLLVVTPTVKLVPTLAVTLCDGGVAAIEKSLTLSVTVAVWTMAPLVAETVRM